jgi:PleD family two-component response regulator
MRLLVIEGHRGRGEDRDDGVRTPILIVTARDGVEERILGLDTGADDYLVKPFHFGGQVGADAWPAILSAAANSPDPSVTTSPVW